MMLPRYRLLQSGAVGDIPKEEYLIADIAPLGDEEHDATYRFSLNGTNSRIGGPADDAVEEAGRQYAAAHNGLLSTDALQLTGYLKKPVDPRKIQDILSRIPPGVTTLQQLQALRK